MPLCLKFVEKYEIKNQWETLYGHMKKYAYLKKIIDIIVGT
jgi:hypothetical protein